MKKTNAAKIDVGFYVAILNDIAFSILDEAHKPKEVKALAADFLETLENLGKSLKNYRRAAVRASDRARRLKAERAANAELERRSLTPSPRFRRRMHAQAQRRDQGES